MYPGGLHAEISARPASGALRLGAVAVACRTTTMHHSFRTTASLLTLTALLAVSGCAVQYDKRGNAVFSADLPELFGSVMDSQPLPDGQSTVTLRRMGDQWSLKFGTLARVVDLGVLRGGRIVSVSQVGNATNILLQIDTPQCARQYRLVSVAAKSQAAVWDLDMPCSGVEPQVQTGRVEQYIDFVVGSRVSRFVYRDGKLGRRPDVVLPPGVTSLPGPAGTAGSGSLSSERYRPGPPFAPSAAQHSQRPAASAAFAPTRAAPAPAPEPAPRSTRSTRTSPAASSPTSSRAPAQTPQHIDFGTEVKPTITVDLTK